MIRVIGGVWKGRRLKVPTGTGTRPSAGRLREALFSSLGSLVPGSEVVDLFAGSGALGIEALSRGAVHATFVEIDPRAVRTLHANLQELRAESSTFRVQRGDARRWLTRQLQEGDRAGAEVLILLDPPYDDRNAGELLPLGARLLESGRCGAFALEHPAEAELPELVATTPSSRLRVRTRRHGLGAFTLLDRG
jgi:16S rRNA (guanine966-N2)-methyltransferase